ncbi:3-deoxy-D-manno-octulosonic-acid transferase (KdtA) (PDB:2XCI) [Commensalibacter communis]|uniref:3-deoxy-D-manno-octulosonic acid transferase n=1 Tax=Commensalibacter communis TaxID=2972786 RepID=A0A9W4TMA0_9PROT|nr:3-deoxy-D-manno-octulosonic acid transferase [Commensalibacter communis]CAI3939824.1 3-deoxy-D-manno-octulosonic-acid transferase (KdtA) (PDB:2XCI) [Commensalibacter communis]CAI3940521.1 3-deoxy-D-manno-octulosonic-acid transferase (KdtA) (PDB:2XCI) [Commensalibacter communis]CAI3943673.1 3-deoxy-D-manno-octulosonic-acid transferase (KdtA) (PDB:2XCI) [Commensalibacter communis]CAI3946130.1 3-deoxy-D-manno-octulosonic-acid transferase (KdtA) (PDB:2XCI) [Commensalibacter communis]CAI3946216.
MSFHSQRSIVILTAWKVIATMLQPLLKPYLWYRCKKGKEIKERLSERMGVVSLPRKSGGIIHFHAASVGEVISIFPIITELYKIEPRQKFLVTTGTVTSSQIVQQYFSNDPELSKHVQHQFIPLDVPKWVERFVSFWQPSLSIIVESELWPNLIDAFNKHQVPIALINARLSDRSFTTWHRFQRTAFALLSKFDWIAARSLQDQYNFEKLGVKATYLGDIKQIAPKLAFDMQELNCLRELFKNKPIWLAASTHATEEIVIAKAHEALKTKWPELITIIVPRHPERSKEIIEQIGQMPQRSLNQLPDEKGLWLCDTLGELGLFYRLCDIVFIGNSLDSTSKGGGHNPFEPAKLHCAMASGNQIHNFKEAYRLLEEVVTITPNVESLVTWVDEMLRDPQKRDKYAQNALHIMDQQSQLAYDIASHLYSLKA